jgi:hypothetical protein
LAIATSITMRLSLQSWFARLATLALLASLSAWALSRLEARVVALSKRERLAWLLGAIAGGVLLALVIPLRPSGFPSLHHLEITALGEHNPASHASEVWVNGVYAAADGARVELRARSAGGWSRREDSWFSTGASPIPLQLDGVLWRDSEVRLGSHAWSGLARVVVDGQERVLDLYDANGITVRVPVAASSSLRGLGFVADLSTLIVLLFAAGLLLHSFQGGHAEPPRPQDAIWMAALCVAGWSVYLLIFYPGGMSPDSVGQWSEMTTGFIDDAHPAIHTLIMWLITRAWRSPAAVAVVQIFALAGAVASALHEFGWWGVPRWVRATLAGVFAASPVHAVMSITLWKDIPYSIAMLFISVLFLRFARTHGEAILSRGASLGLSFAAGIAALTRHNGVPTVALIFVVLIVCLRERPRRRAALLMLATLVVCLGLRMSLFRALHVAPIPTATANSPLVHQLAAVVHYAPESFSPAERALLEKVGPWKDWREGYQCDNVNGLFFDRGLQWYHLFDTPDEKQFRPLWWHQVWSHKLLALRHTLCASEHVWRVMPSGLQPLIAFEIYKNDIGLHQESKWPAAERVLKPWLFSIEDSARYWWLWRTAAWMYLAIFVTIVVAVRLRTWWLPLWLVPALLNGLVIMPLSMTQDFRYGYPMYLVAMLTPALAFARRL